MVEIISARVAATVHPPLALMAVYQNLSTTSRVKEHSGQVGINFLLTFIVSENNALLSR